MNISRTATPAETVMTMTGDAEGVLDRLNRGTQNQMIWKRPHASSPDQSCAHIRRSARSPY
jgi:hypothetical protein